MKSATKPSKHTQDSNKNPGHSGFAPTAPHSSNIGWGSSTSLPLINRSRNRRPTSRPPATKVRLRPHWLTMAAPTPQRASRSSGQARSAPTAPATPNSLRACACVCAKSTAEASAASPGRNSKGKDASNTPRLTFMPKSAHAVSSRHSAMGYGTSSPPGTSSSITGAASRHSSAKASKSSKPPPAPRERPRPKGGASQVLAALHACLLRSS
mmetsp:Transcript_152908/g.490553  ORF Transcript_152908/g.490553 Transcript_152908/m.490553 type:complete len:211 (+) Transcript_152908:853-1485(+)